MIMNSRLQMNHFNFVDRRLVEAEWDWSWWDWEMRWWGWWDDHDEIDPDEIDHDEIERWEMMRLMRWSWWFNHFNFVDRRLGEAEWETWFPTPWEVPFLTKGGKLLHFFSLQKISIFLWKSFEIVILIFSLEDEAERFNNQVWSQQVSSSLLFLAPNINQFHSRSHFFHFLLFIILFLQMGSTFASTLGSVVKKEKWFPERKTVD